MIENPGSLTFPETQSDIKSLQTNIKYFGLITKNIPETIAFNKIEYCRLVKRQLI